MMTPWQVSEPIFTIPEDEWTLAELRRELVSKQQSLKQIETEWQKLLQSPTYQAEQRKTFAVYSPQQLLPETSLQLDNLHKTIEWKLGMFHDKSRTLKRNIHVLENLIADRLQDEDEDEDEESPSSSPVTKQRDEQQAPLLYDSRRVPAYPTSTQCGQQSGGIVQRSKSSLIDVHSSHSSPSRALLTPYSPSFLNRSSYCREHSATNRISQ
jgi:hypothetical protein